MREQFGLTPNTLDAYARAIDSYCFFLESREHTWETSTQGDVAGWINELRTRGLSNATLIQRVTAVRLFFEYLVEEGLRPGNPVSRGGTFRAMGPQSSERRDPSEDSTGCKGAMTAANTLQQVMAMAALLCAVDLPELRNQERRIIRRHSLTVKIFGQERVDRSIHMVQAELKRLGYTGHFHSEVRNALRTLSGQPECRTGDSHLRVP